jgi:NitT/TauT family transport system substrate-binding protein
MENEDRSTRVGGDREALTRFEAIAAMSALVATARAPALAQPATIPLHIGTVLAESYANAFYALDDGIFKRVGLDVTIDTFASGGAIMAAVSAGALEVGAGSTVSSANAHLHGLPIRLIAPGGVYTTQSPTTLLAVTRDSTITSAKDLVGKTIGVTTLRDLAQISVMAWIDKNGVDSKSASYVELAPSAMGPSVLQSRVDAVFIGEPYLTQNLANLRILGSPYDAIASRFLITGWTASIDWLSKNLETAKRFATAIRLVDESATSNPRKYLPILSKYTKVPVETLEAMHHVGWVPKVSAALIQPVIDASVQYKLFPQNFSAADMFFGGLN